MLKLVFKFHHGEVHLLVVCFLVVPDLACPSRLCRWWLLPCLLLVPADRAVFVFVKKMLRF